MKNLILTSQDDAASMNIREKLLAECKWKKIDVFNSFPVYESERFYMVHIKGPKIHAENVDALIREKIGIGFGTIIVASKHRSASNMKSLTVHPIGNWGMAEAGGQSGHVVPVNPWLMTEALRLLKKYQFGDYNVTFEATHHGPYLTTPTFFIEIGSTDEEWRDERAGAVLARVILEAEERRYLPILGFGGGHYMPRLTDVALKYRVSVGHMFPKYAMPNLSEAVVREGCEKSMCKGAYIHRKGLNGEERRRVREVLAEVGIKEMSSDDFEPL